MRSSFSESVEAALVGTQWKAVAKGEEGTRGKTEENKAMIYKRGKFYWYKFMWDGNLVRESTRQGNDKVARNMESAHRTSLAKGEVGIRDKKVTPSVVEFLKRDFL